MSFPDDPRDLKLWMAFGHTDAEDLGSVVWTQVSPDPDDETDPGPVLDPIRIRRGRIGDAGATDPTQFGFGLRNTDGEFSRRNVSGPHFGQLRQGTPAKVTVDVGSGDEVVATAAVQDFTPSRSGPGIDLRVPGRVLGVLSRLGRDGEIVSPLTRVLTYYSRVLGSVVEHWPMEDVDGSTSFASAIAGRQPITVSGSVDFAAASDLIGSKPLPSFAASTGLSVPVTAAFSSGDWCVQWLFKLDAMPASSTVLMDVRTTGGAAERWVVILASTSLTVTAYDGSGATVYTATDGTISIPTDEWCTVNFSGNSGSGLLALVTPATGGAIYAAALAAGIGAAGAPTQLLVPASAELAGMAMGHLNVSDQAGEPSVSGSAGGNDGSPATTRIEALLSGAGIAYDVGPGDSPQMGPEGLASLLSKLRDAEAVDGGVLYEARDGTITFQPLASRYNAPVALTLAYGSEADPGDVSDLPMFDDDRDVVNLVTVTRSGGSSRTVEHDTGPVGTGTAEGVGARRLARTLSLYEDGQAVHHAGFLLALGTVDKPRYRVILNPHTVTALRTQVLGVDVGSRIQITGAPPEDHGPDTLDLIVEGEEILIDSDTWEVAWWCEPYQPYQVNVLAEDDPGDDGDEPIGWLEADSCELASPVDKDDTSWSMTCVPDETSDPDDFPFDVFVNGERVTVTASTGGGSPTWTVTRSVNGAEKSHAAGTPAVLADPLILSLV